MWSLRGFIPDGAFVQCDLDLQSLEAKRPYYTDKLAATTCIRVQSECISTFLLYIPVCEQRRLVIQFFGFQVSVI